MPADDSLPFDAPARRRLSADERRAQILAVAQQVFLEEGVERTSIRRIAERAGVTAPVIYNHFEDKESLLLAICQEYFKGMIAAFQASPATDDTSEGPFTRLRGMMRVYVDFGLKHPDVYRLVFMTNIAALKRDKLPKGHRRRADDTAQDPAEIGFGGVAFGILEGEIKRLMTLGLLKGDDPYAVAEVVWSAGHGLVSLMITHAHFEWTPFDKLLGLSLEAMLHGITR